MPSVEAIIGKGRVRYKGIPWDAANQKRGPSKTFAHESDAMNYARGWERDRDHVAAAFGVPVRRNQSRREPELLDDPIPAERGSADHTLYMLYDEDGALLYIGITDRGPRRLVQHYKDKPWFGEVARSEFYRCPTRRGAEAQEVALIKELHPRHNVVHNGLRVVPPLAGA